MKKLTLLLLFLPFLGSAQLKLRPYISGGEFKDMVRQDYKQINRFVPDPTASTKGFFAGLDLSAVLAFIRIGFQLEAACEKHNLNYHVEDHVRAGGFYQIIVGWP